MELKSQRAAYGETLVRFGGTYRDVVVLEADLGKSTMGSLFEAEYGERFFEVGIAEANMVSIAGGLALTGKIPFIATFAVFMTGRPYDQIRTGVCIPGLNVKLCGSSAGLSDFGDGSTHQSIDDMALMRVLPNMQVFSPVDAVQTAQVMEYMVKNPGPMYLRVNRNNLPVLTGAEDEFVCGRPYSLRTGRDVVVFATGVMVSRALEAAGALDAEGIAMEVVNIPTIKPLDAGGVRTLCKGKRAVITAEEHSVIGGLGDAIADALAEDPPPVMRKIGMQDCFGTSAEGYEELLAHYGLTAEAIARAAKECLAR